MKIAYYRVSAKNGRAYWCPTVRMRSLGFMVTPLGFDGPDAHRQAAELNARWQAARKELPRRSGPREPKAGKSFVYFIQVENRVKIGTSRKPFSRAAAVAGGAHGALLKVIIVPGARMDEKRLHARFSSYRVNGEWFVAARPLQLTMTRCAMAGSVVHDGTEREPRVESSGLGGVESSKPTEALSV